eukprot:126195-Chlamydomonas_euryale.AAC.4
MGDNGERWEKPPEEHCCTQAPRDASPTEEKQSGPIVKRVQEGNSLPFCAAFPWWCVPACTAVLAPPSTAQACDLRVT